MSFDFLSSTLNLKLLIFSKTKKKYLQQLQRQGSSIKLTTTCVKEKLNSVKNNNYQNKTPFDAEEQQIASLVAALFIIIFWWNGTGDVQV